LLAQKADELLIEHEALKLKCHDQEENISELEENLRLKTDYAINLQASMSELYDELLDEKHVYQKISDATIVELWEGLVFDISQLASFLAKQHPDESHIPENCSDATYMDNLVRCFNRHQWLGAYALQRYIWNRLVREVFLARKSIWSGKVGRKFVEFYQQLQGKPSMRQSRQSSCS
jgi:hypothetical protein